jgi:hypothetical protein
MLSFGLQINVTLDSDTRGSLARIAKALEEIAFWARPHFAVGPVSVRTKWERPMSQFAYTFNLPKPASPDDVAARVLSVATNGGAAAETPIDKMLPVSPEFVFDDGAMFTVQVIDSDAAGNKAAGPLLTVTVVDDVPPATPGELAVASKRQV